MSFVQTFPFKPITQGTNSVCCTSDGYFVYAGGRSVNFIKPGERPLIKVFNTNQNITNIDIDPCWNTEGRIFATLASEKSILIWDFDKGIAISGHKAHCRMQSKAIEGAGKTNAAVHIGFLKNRNLLSLCCNDLVVYCVASNSICVRPKFAPGKGQVLTALKCSPYNERIFALGTNRGQVYICDLQKMSILYTLGGHQAPVTSLSWNRIAIPSESPKIVKNPKPPLFSSAAVEENDDMFNIYDYDYLENEFGAPSKTDKSKDTDAEVKTNEVSLNPNFNFQEACESLKQEINDLNKNVDAEDPVECNAVTLEDCRSSKNIACLSSMGDSIESTEGSLEVVDQSSSSDESRHVDGREVDPKKVTAVHEMKHDIGGEENENTLPMTQKDTVASEEKNDILLASASSDCQIFIWNAETGGCCDNLKSTKRNSSKETANIHIIWRSSTEFYVLDAQGEMHKWTLLPNSSMYSSSKRSYKFEKLAGACTDIKAYAFGISENLDFLWYISTKREIVCKNMKTSETILNYGTATSGIMVACESPENNSKIAFGFADGRIALLETSQLSNTKIVMQYLQVRLAAFARALAWSEDGCNIAYGTYGGKVGYVNIDTLKHVTLRTIFGNPVYSIQWSGEDIFMTCNDKLFAYKNGNSDPLSIEGLKNPVSTVSIRHGYIFLGNARGCIDIYRESSEEPHTLTLNFIQSVEVAKHYITDIAWNPLKDDQFAVVANEKDINLLSFNVNTGTATLERKLNFGVPKAVISTVKWSNRDSQRFVTSGFDGALRVFDLSRQNNEELVFVKQFHCPLHTAMLLPRDEQYALCTGKSITVEIVDTNHSDDITLPSKYKTLDHIQWAVKMSIGSSNISNKKKDKAAVKKLTKEPENVAVNDLTDKISELDITKADTPADKQDISKNSSNFLKTPPTLMHLITKEQNKFPLERLHKYLKSKSSMKLGEEPVFISQLFGNKKDAQKVLNAELEKVKTQTSLAELGNMFMSQVKGDIRDVILKAIKTRQLNDIHIALAPTISYSFWQKCCRAFAEQLLEQGYALQAATYMLGLHNQREAINMLVTANFCKEALLIGRVYLPENDPLLTDITNKWIAQLESHGNLAGAALICAVSQQYMRGYEILSKQRVIGPEEANVIDLLKTKANA